jgi:hypothetical protein
MVEKLRDLIIDLLHECENEDTLDLVHKLLLAEGC